MKLNLDQMWKEFRYSHTKNPHCMLTNRELFKLFSMEIQAEIERIASIEPGCHERKKLSEIIQEGTYPKSMAVQIKDFGKKIRKKGY